MPTDSESQTEIDSLRQIYKLQKCRLELAIAYLTSVIKDPASSQGEQMIAQMTINYLQEN